MKGDTYREDPYKGDTYRGDPYKGEISPGKNSPLNKVAQVLPPPPLEMDREDKEQIDRITKVVYNSNKDSAYLKKGKIAKLRRSQIKDRFINTDTSKQSSCVFLASPRDGKPIL